MLNEKRHSWRAFVLYRLGFALIRKPQYKITHLHFDYKAFLLNVTPRYSFGSAASQYVIFSTF